MAMNLGDQSYQPVKLGGFSEAFSRGAAAVPDLGAKVAELLSTSLQQQGGMERTAVAQKGAMSRTKLTQSGANARSSQALAAGAGAKQDDIMKEIMKQTAAFARARNSMTGELPTQEQIYAHAQDLARIYQQQGYTAPPPIQEDPAAKGSGVLDWLKNTLQAAGQGVMGAAQNNPYGAATGMYSMAQPSSGMSNIAGPGMAAGARVGREGAQTAAGKYKRFGTVNGRRVGELPDGSVVYVE